MNRKLTKSISGVVVGAAIFATAIAPAGAQRRVHPAEASVLRALYTSATPGSPAQFRIHEELDRLADEGNAPPSPAQFRLAEEQSR